MRQDHSHSTKSMEALAQVLVQCAGYRVSYRANGTWHTSASEDVLVDACALALAMMERAREGGVSA